MKYLLITILISLVASFSLLAQPATVEEDIWQEAWEGVPEYYQNWDYPDFQIPDSQNQWEDKREDVKATLIDLLGDLPPRPEPLEVRTVYKKQMPGYILEKFVFDNGLDSKEVPGYIAIPDDINGKAPAILGMHGHGSSKDNIFGSDPRTQQAILASLISRGYIVMAIDSYFNGERRGTGPAGKKEMQERRANQEMSLFKLNLWFGRSLWGLQLRDEQIALDYLLSRPEVDADRIGVTGMSMGATRSWWLAAIDDRVDAVVGVACFTRYKELIEQRKLSAHGIYYFVPGMLKHFDSEAVMSLIAPRPYLTLTGDSDHGSPLSGIRVLEDKLDEVYGVYGDDEKFKSIVYENTGHVYTDEMKMEMVRWFDRWME